MDGCRFPNRHHVYAENVCALVLAIRRRLTTGNGVAGSPGACKPGSPTGTTTEFDEGIDIDKTKLNGGAPNGGDGGINSIDPKKLERDPAHNCAPVYPWNFVRTNTIFGVVHQARGYRMGRQASVVLLGFGSRRRQQCR
jgi:hypothetical protein